mmetsp:Transcript_26962/g.48738  ORF Transcript_26962/g.48738 Transcript_26962/m.48738 type:complete len:422 (-) Transcript_26962:13-1278(-)
MKWQGFNCASIALAVFLSSLHGVAAVKFAIHPSASLSKHDFQNRTATSALINLNQAQATYNEETPVVVFGFQTHVTVEGIFAAIFVAMIASVPVVIGYIEAIPSKTQLLQSAIMLLWLMSCLYLFTQQVEFKSVHFTGQRPLTLVETIYLMAQVLTTVGHGDIEPATPSGKAVVGSYVLFTILVIADMVSAVVHIAIVNTRGFYTKKLSSYHKKGKQTKNEEEGCKDDEEWKEWLSKEAPPLPWKKLAMKFGGFLLFVFMGAAFYHLYPGENRTWLEGIYMAIVTLTSVGFGAGLPRTEAGKVFGAFWMLFGVVSLLRLVGGVTELMLAFKARELWDPQLEDAQLERLRQKARMADDGSLVVDKYDFLLFGILHAKLLREEDLAKIETTFKMLGPNSDQVSFESIKQAVASREIQQPVKSV